MLVIKLMGDFEKQPGATAMSLSLSNQDLSIITFQGLSRSWVRKVAILTTFGIWLVLAFAAYKIGIAMEALSVTPTLSILIASSLVFQLSFFPDHFLPKKAAMWLIEWTPIGVLYRQDKEVLSKARRKLISISQQIDFRKLQGYSKINPALDCRAFNELVTHQTNGDLEQWITNTEHLKWFADMVYQLALVERFCGNDGLSTEMLRQETSR